MKNKYTLATIRTRAMEDLLKRAGYKCHHCHLTRMEVLAMLWISLNDLALLKSGDAIKAYHAIYERLLELRSGKKYGAQTVKGIWASGLREGEGVVGRCGKRKGGGTGRCGGGGWQAGGGDVGLAVGEQALVTGGSGTGLEPSAGEK